tara:strand:- start:143 stop:307 length:165 start_codon:yes stop_codon:yes gene_type:complete
MTEDFEKELKKLKKEKKLNDEFMEKLLTSKTDENFKLRQEVDKLKERINDKKTS